MTRIIAGSAGGRRLRTPPGDTTRPTSDRVREGLFSALESLVGSLDGLRFLDLYAGSGAVGLEAFSRGAGVVTLVEQHRRTAALARANAATLRAERAEVLTGAVGSVLLRRPAAPYDVAFLDPPYPMPGEEVGAAVRHLVAQDWLCPGAVVVVERSSRSGGWTWPAGMSEVRSRRYGETVLHYGRRDRW